MSAEQRVSDERPEDVYDRMIREAEAAAYTRGFGDARAEIVRLVKALDLVERCFSLEAARNIAHATLALRPASPEHEEMK